MADFKIAIDKVLKNEGGYVDNPLDLGGTTNFGISLRFLQGVDKTATKDTIKNLTLKQAEDLYYNYFWLPNKYNEINSQAIANKIFDTAVNMGSTVANKLLQQALNIVITSDSPLTEDGIIGYTTINTVNRYGSQFMSNRLFLSTYILLQKERYASIVAYRNDQVVFLKGWLKRAEEV